LAPGQGDLVKRIILMAVLGVGLALPALAQAVAPTQPIYFWSSTADAVSVPKGAVPQGNARVIRPSVIAMHADGSWDIDHLRWSGWGRRVAHATGISNASNGIPNEAQGRRIKRPANLILSDPGRFEGHEVYRCFTVTVPTFPGSDERLCLKDQAGYHYFESTAAQFDDHLLRNGQVTESGGFRCSSAINQITCIVLAGRGANKGFVISANGVARVGASVASNGAS
jgi:hypothetical protein